MEEFNILELEKIRIKWEKKKIRRSVREVQRLYKCSSSFALSYSFYVNDTFLVNDIILNNSTSVSWVYLNRINILEEKSMKCIYLATHKTQSCLGPKYPMVKFQNKREGKWKLYISQSIHFQRSFNNICLFSGCP
jgi:hypothetical protein